MRRWYAEKSSAAGLTEPEQEQGQAQEPVKPKIRLSRLEQLQQQLVEAVAKEEYEKAAKLRDEILRLEARNS